MADTRISCHKVLGSLPREDAQSTSTHQILAAGLGAMLPSGLKAFPRTSLGVENVGATALGPQEMTARPQMCTGLPASPAQTCVWVPSFLPSSQNPSDFKSDPSHTWACTKTGLNDSFHCRFVGKVCKTTETPGKPAFGVTMKYETRLLSCGLGFFLLQNIRRGSSGRERDSRAQAAWPWEPGIRIHPGRQCSLAND